jgi:antirestriction protein ArdC
MSNLYEQVTNQIIKAIEANNPPWRRPWSGLTPMILPCNAQTKKPYRGINIPILWMTSYFKGYKTPLWGTLETWKRLGGRLVNKKQSPTDVYFYRFFKSVNKGKEKVVPLMRTYQVYNLDQIYGCFTLAQEWNPKPIISEDQLVFEPAEKVIKACKAKITYAGNIAAYSPELDRIKMPPKNQFRSRIGFWTTILHEHAHWTGHEKRLKREFGASHTPEYYFEELVAEMSACFLTSMLGLPEALDQMPQHASYLKSYLRLLKSDNKIIFKAASAATRATDFILNGGKKEVALSEKVF